MGKIHFTYKFGLFAFIVLVGQANAIELSAIGKESWCKATGRQFRMTLFGHNLNPVSADMPIVGFRGTYELYQQFPGQTQPHLSVRVQGTVERITPVNAVGTPNEEIWIRLDSESLVEVKNASQSESLTLPSNSRIETVNGYEYLVYRNTKDALSRTAGCYVKALDGVEFETYLGKKVVETYSALMAGKKPVGTESRIHEIFENLIISKKARGDMKADDTVQSLLKLEFLSLLEKAGITPLSNGYVKAVNSLTKYRYLISANSMLALALREDPSLLTIFAENMKFLVEHESIAEKLAFSYSEDLKSQMHLAMRLEDDATLAPQTSENLLRLLKTRFSAVAQTKAFKVDTLRAEIQSLKETIDYLEAAKKKENDLYLTLLDMDGRQKDTYNNITGEWEPFRSTDRVKAGQNVVAYFDQLKQAYKELDEKRKELNLLLGR